MSYNNTSPDIIIDPGYEIDALFFRSVSIFMLIYFLFFSINNTYYAKKHTTINRTKLAFSICGVLCMILNIFSSFDFYSIYNGEKIPMYSADVTLVNIFSLQFVCGQ